MRPNKNWSLKFSPRGGHRYFIDNTNGRTAVADESGLLPNQTEDGILYVVEDEPIKCGQYATITVERPDGTRAQIIECLEAAILVARELGMKFSTYHGDYVLVRVTEKTPSY